MDIRLFLSEGMRNTTSKELLKKIIDDFKQYKNGGKQPSNFGRDEAYDFPFTVKEAELQHIHLKDSKSTKWHLKKILFHKTSDTALIYCQGSTWKNCYLLISILENAHSTYQVKPMYLSELAEQAESFREKF
jgi:mRNA interferase YafO